MFKFQNIPGNWNVVQIKSTGNVITGKTPSTKNESYWNPPEIPFITPGDIEDSLYLLENERYVSVKGANNVNILPKNSIMTVCIGSTIGKVALSSQKCVTNQQINSIIPNNTVDPSFLCYSLKNRSNYLKSLAGVAAVPIVNKSLFESFKILLPPLSEQQKIASILSNVDAIIQSTQQLITQLQMLKKGLMQKLFTEGLGHTEFKESLLGRIPKEWEVLKLKDIVIKFLNGGTPPTNKSELWNGDIPWITSNNVNGLITGAGDKFINEDGLKYSNIIPKGNLLIVTRVGLGKFSITDVDLSINQDFTGAILNHEKIYRIYLVNFLDHYQEKLKNLKQGSTIQGLIRRDIERFLILVPPFQEQVKIGNILSNIDKKIEIELNYHMSLKIVKKGLMQQLLTGKTRVKT